MAPGWRRPHADCARIVPLVSRLHPTSLLARSRRSHVPSPGRRGSLNPERSVATSRASTTMEQDVSIPAFPVGVRRQMPGRARAVLRHDPKRCRRGEARSS
jgi:hypothetical protein